MTGMKRGLLALLMMFAGTVAWAIERDGFLQHQYRTQCLAFAEDPESFRQRLENGALPQLPSALVRQLLMGNDSVQGWALAYQGRREYVLVLAEDENSCAIVARYADVNYTLSWFEQLMLNPPEGYDPERLQTAEAEGHFAGNAQINRWAWNGSDRVLTHSLMVSEQQDAQIQAILSLTLTMKQNEE
ncbi:NMCC_0638 family (lipo)protein [Marinobacterium sediminicola]|uniref:Uncharacterized protein n=1 Tax=Marinobacterium sediminicola TaxID=518898 RepID=A0ABY1S1K0_9GAMM|nr:hypothetical protein [Marinobacterium sediminicola]ULG69817.1 hypothetical protein LN244_03135 [Marinobacterium sediminicola]SMR75369.1 hypothetical protein SAMN04487964_10931 [Marinobacterium sediminicola]